MEKNIHISSESHIILIIFRIFKSFSVVIKIKKKFNNKINKIY